MDRLTNLTKSPRDLAYLVNQSLSYGLRNGSKKPSDVYPLHDERAGRVFGPAFFYTVLIYD